MNANNGATPQSTYIPDVATVERIKYLATVGIALNQTASDTTFHTNFFVAKEALLKFKEGIDKLQLESADRKGIEDLIEYLQKKMDKRIQHADQTGEVPMV